MQTLRASDLSVELGLERNQAFECVRIWTGDPPGSPATLPTPALMMNGADPPRSEWAKGIAAPALYVFRPKQPNGAGLLIIPSGAYAFVSFHAHGFEIARRFVEDGFTCFVLLYRLPAEGWEDRALVPLQDAQRAMRIIRCFAAHFAIDPEKLGAIGFSSGGHLAASLATRFWEPTYPPADQADRINPRPAFVGLLCPALTHYGTHHNLLGPEATQTEINARSPSHRIPKDVPPCFLAHARDDDAVSVTDSEEFLAGLNKKGAAVEAHFFDQGGHDLGHASAEELPIKAWPDLFAKWAKGVVGV